VRTSIKEHGQNEIQQQKNQGNFYRLNNNDNPDDYYHYYCINTNRIYYSEGSKVKYYGSFAQSKNCGVRETSIARQQLRKIGTIPEPSLSNVRSQQ
jgi:hypothetical protein